ncbi:hypothetical protein LSH36_33g03011 [Paralvinella palmiformis]|uniref:V-type proton ATPase subunit F n=1 Tax=Paralvinella palmiformis TaxID=53620 RepID=A0AAD9K905_9ANNE|nr:hypothetical protein LSH36_33g03011 [Paralvinella palmiformis]
MDLCFLPAHHTLALFGQLQGEASIKSLRSLMEYLRKTLIVSIVWLPSAWSVYGLSICTDNDIEGWHNILNKRGCHHMPFYILITLLHDEARLDTCTGFLLGGIGELDKHRQPNFLVINKDTSISEIEDAFRKFSTRSDIAIILINQNAAEMIRHEIDAHTQTIPAILEIPSKECPYDPAKDSILRRARGMFSAEDFR